MAVAGHSTVLVDSTNGMEPRSPPAPIVTEMPIRLPPTRTMPA